MKHKQGHIKSKENDEIDDELLHNEIQDNISKDTDIVLSDDKILNISNIESQIDLMLNSKSYIMNDVVLNNFKNKFSIAEYDKLFIILKLNSLATFKDKIKYLNKLSFSLIPNNFLKLIDVLIRIKNMDTNGLIKYFLYYMIDDNDIRYNKDTKMIYRSKMLHRSKMIEIKNYDFDCLLCNFIIDENLENVYNKYYKSDIRELLQKLEERSSKLYNIIKNVEKEEKKYTQTLGYPESKNIADEIIDKLPERLGPQYEDKITRLKNASAVSKQIQLLKSFEVDNDIINEVKVEYKKFFGDSITNDILTHVIENSTDISDFLKKSLKIILFINKDYVGKKFADYFQIKYQFVENDEDNILKFFWIDEKLNQDPNIDKSLNYYVDNICKRYLLLYFRKSDLYKFEYPKNYDFFDNYPITVDESILNDLFENRIRESNIKQDDIKESIMKPHVPITDDILNELFVGVLKDIEMLEI